MIRLRWFALGFGVSLGLIYASFRVGGKLLVRELTRV